MNNGHTYRLVKDGQNNIVTGSFDKVWNFVIANYGHMSLKDFANEGYLIEKLEG